MERLTERNPYWLGEEFWTSAKEPDEDEIDKVYERLKYYEDLQEQGRLLELPCSVGDTVWCIYIEYTQCTKYNQKFDEFSCQGCECLECNSQKIRYVQSQNAYSMDWIISNMNNFGKVVFLTREEAEKALEGKKE